MFDNQISLSLIKMLQL